MSQVKRVLNLKKAPHDPRDFKYKALMAVQDLAIKQSVDLEKHCPPIWDQGQEGSCTGHAWGAHKAFLDMQYVPYVPPSRQFIYYNERVIDGTVREDAGANMRDGADVLLNTGVCPESLWPYTMGDMLTKPTAAAFAGAVAHKIGAYYAVTSENQMLHCLSQGFPFALGINVPSNFMDDELAKTGIMQMPKAGESIEGGHALLAVGFDQKKAMAKIRNSWGTSWGQNGYFWMPFDFLFDPNWTSDCFTARLAHQKGLMDPWISTAA